MTLHSGEQALYKVKLSTIHDHVASFEVNSFDPKHGLVKCLEIPCGSKEFTYQFVYAAPELDRPQSEVTLTFIATDNEGNQASLTRKVTVVNRVLSIAEKTGIIMFEPGAGLPDALTLADVSHPFSLADSPQPEAADIYVDPTTGFEAITWRSNSRTKFLRANNFDYAGATAAGITSVFASSVVADHVSDIRVNDIILVGHGDVAEGVFYVVNILRGESAPDCMQLSFKGVDVADDRPAPEPEGDD
ncbi:MAG: hypothetical protein K2I28_07365 [Muribaculaceae bacterium]|nr:hypothetical protein [Muribaculaceae bacterium]